MPAMLGCGSCWVFVVVVIVVVVVIDDCDKCEKLNVSVGLCNKNDVNMPILLVRHFFGT